MNVVTLGPRLNAICDRTYRIINPERLLSRSLVHAVPVTMKSRNRTRKPQNWITFGLA
jgi:hypothetical protein